MQSWRGRMERQTISVAKRDVDEGYGRGDQITLDCKD